MDKTSLFFFPSQLHLDRIATTKTSSIQKRKSYICYTYVSYLIPFFLIIINEVRFITNLPLCLSLHL